MKLNIFLLLIWLLLLTVFGYLILTLSEPSIIKNVFSDNETKSDQRNVIDPNNNIIFPYSKFRLGNFANQLPENSIYKNINFNVQTNNDYLEKTNQSAFLDVPIIFQNPELPNGCEITALTSVFHYYGYLVDKVKMSDFYLYQSPFIYINNRRYGPDPNVGFAGSPKDQNGWYAFAGPIAQAAKIASKSLETNLKTENISGSTTEEIDNWIKQGVPVIMWVTLNLEEPNIDGGWFIKGTNEFHSSYTNLHAVVLLKSTENEVIVMDPLKGYVKHEKSKLFQSYEALNKQAIILKDF